MARLLLIDDDPFFRETIGRVLDRMGHEPLFAATLEEGRSLLWAERPDVVFLDLRLPDGYGLSLMSELRQGADCPEVIIVTGEEDPEGAELAIKSGAWDYLQKPVTQASLALPLVRALEYRAQKAAKRPRAVLKREGIVGVSRAIEFCLEQVAQAADSDAGVLVTGETGTGKELFARAIHANSPRVNSNFVVVDCAALPETLVESVLFGHVKGAFTGADRDRDGLFRLADGGTLFLDEIGELSPAIQKVFLRVLQDGRFRAVGAKHESQSDFRLVAATNRDLGIMAERGGFRDDLLYRLKTMVISLPPLRERPEDIKPLAIHYMNRLCERYRIPTKGFSEEFFMALAAHPWPGNVRELFNTLERMLLQHRDQPVLYPMHLPDDIRIRAIRAGSSARGGPGRSREALAGETCQTPSQGAAGSPAVGEDAPGMGSGAVAAPCRALGPVDEWKKYRRRALEEAEHRYLRELMEETGGNVSRASAVSGLSPSRMYDLLRKYGLPTR
ncbi:sigma-54-dependent transcriptional regulator [Desulfolutivibrio sulfoxidireducens]|uniref:sigma-54-dependent transcriptional regulator n=1 Tax=Desulfolutivibrio sulfoxidireducens TaxID=2773299 RepID=UPI00159E4447|nr:sigma-54 dependent transcriptional regulator [Desulfolutivibrio sulfoxidireducens]QLA14699.1 response regulator [Desulfolutivibrio sulfoxidireducens]QLA18281.1 response regulator [Desulfolutivibrio sulfoxidireducens]